MRNGKATLCASLWLVGLMSAASAQVTFNNLVHTPLGHATLALADPVLKVDNIGDLGSDGVKIEVKSESGENAVEFVWAVELPDMPAGAEFVTKYYGDHPDRGTILIGSSTMKAVDNGAEMTPDYAGSSYKLELMRDGEVVYTEDAKMGPAVTAAASKGKICWFGTGICSYHFGITTASEVHDVSVVNGPTVAADMIVITPDPATFVGVTSITSCEATGSGFPSFTIGEETVVSNPASVGDRPNATALRVISAMERSDRSGIAAQVALPSVAPVRVELVDMRGNVVRAEVTEPLRAGEQEISVPLADATGSRLPSGVYLLRIVAGARAATGKVLITQ